MQSGISPAPPLMLHEPFKDEIQKAAQYWYKKYHGGMDGFDQVQAQAKASLNPPAGFTITPAPPPPSPQELAHNAVTSTPDLKTMALTDKEFVLANGNQADASAGMGHHEGLDHQGAWKGDLGHSGLRPARRLRRCAAVEQGGLHHQHEDPVENAAHHRFHGELHCNLRLVHAESGHDHHEGRERASDHEATRGASHHAPHHIALIVHKQKEAGIHLDARSFLSLNRVDLFAEHEMPDRFSSSRCRIALD